MRTTTVSEDGTTVTITTDSEFGLTAHRVAEMLYDAMLGSGFQPSNVAESMIDTGKLFGPKDPQ